MPLFDLLLMEHGTPKGVHRSLPWEFYKHLTPPE
jgi:hypothetical protein